MTLEEGAFLPVKNFKQQSRRPCVCSLYLPLPCCTLFFHVQIPPFLLPRVQGKLKQYFCFLGTFSDHWAITKAEQILFHSPMLFAKATNRHRYKQGILLMLLELTSICFIPICRTAQILSLSFLSQYARTCNLQCQ